MILSISPDPDYWGDVTVEEAREEFEGGCKVFGYAGFFVDRVDNRATTSETWVFWNGGDREEHEWFDAYCDSDGVWQDVKAELQNLAQDETLYIFERVVMLEKKCRWAVEQFEEISHAIASQSTAYAHSHSLTCIPEMDPDWEGLSTGHITADEA